MSDTTSTLAERFKNEASIAEALREAARDARRFHKAMGNPMATSIDGRVVWVQPEDIRIEDEPQDSESGVQDACMEFRRITTNPRQLGGLPCLRGLRIPVATIVALLAEGEPTSGILALYPDLEAEDIREALLFAAEAVRERTLPVAVSEWVPDSITHGLQP